MGADNQQRRLDIKLGWLGGIIDGEGMITVIKRTDGYSFIPRISIANSDKKIIEEVEEILRNLDLPYYLQSKKYEVGNKIRVKFEILINGLKRCSQVLPHIIPFLVSKKEKAIKLLAWCEYRLSKNSREKYTKKDDEILIIRQRSNPLRDYTPNTN